MSIRVSCSAKCFTGMFGKRYELSRWDGGPRNAGSFLVLIRQGLRLQEGRFGVQLLVPVEQQLEHLLRLREGAVGVQEHVHERALELTVVGREGIDQPGEGGRLNEPHPYRLPLQVRYLIVGILLLVEGEDKKKVSPEHEQHVERILDLLQNKRVLLTLLALGVGRWYRTFLR
uniref:Uncharacterized protein n=1 Tax=Anopheles farauti TaxID=69004 RepID=A0A182PZJ7_9DIPT